MLNLDTHILLHALAGSSRAKERELLSGNVWSISAIVRWEITLTLLLGNQETTTHLTPLPVLLVDVLRYLHLPLTLYTDLRDISTFDISIPGK